VLDLRQDNHFQRISTTYVRLLKEVPPARVPLFKQYVDEVVAYALILCFQAGFPTHRDTFRGNHFVQQMLDLCAEWVRGFRPARIRTGAAWLRKAVAGRQSRDLSTLLSSPSSAGNGNGDAGLGANPWGLRDFSQRHLPQPRRRVRLVLKHSPMVQQYLNANGTRDMPHLAARMTWTEDLDYPARTMAMSAVEYSALTHENRRAKRPSSGPLLTEVLATCRSACSSAATELASQHEQFESEMRSIRQGNFQYCSSRPQTAELTDLIQSGDVHETANYIMEQQVSLRKGRAPSSANSVSSRKKRG
jgi:hypothetical protein